MKNTLLFCCGMSGSGKSFFIKNTLPQNLFYSLKSATTRAMRDGEQDGCEYYFRDEDYFNTEKFATLLWVNEAFWTPKKPKWLYGVPEFEIQNNLGRNMTYDVIQPKYARQMIDWFIANDLQRYYNFRTAYFLPIDGNFDTAARRANMPDDMAVRKQNTCAPVDFINAGLDVDYMLMPRAGVLNPRLQRHVAALARAR